ncbi:hypothetical protein ACTQ5P_08435 [Bacillota bacterium LCP21S3_G6]
MREIISIKRNAYPGIILRRQKHLCEEKSSSRDYFAEAKHLCKEKSPSRDYFAEAEASLQGETLIQGLFCGGRSISAKRKVHPGIILRRQKHLCKEKRSSGDYFGEAEASLQREKFIQGCFDIKKASSIASKSF